MNGFRMFFKTASWLYVKNLIVGVAAGVVMIGALFKLTHWKGADIMLTVGLVTEAFIFTLLGILPPNKEYHWERYYPDIDKDPEVEAYKKGVKFKAGEINLNSGVGGIGGASAVGELDKMMEEAGISVPNLQRLNTNFQKFGDTLDQMKDITDVVAATGSYTENVNEASSALNEMKDTFLGTSNTMKVFNDASDSTAQFHDQLQVLSKNLGSLNQLYEVELEDSHNHLKAMNKFYGNLVNASEAMAESAEDAQAAKSEIAALSRNLSALNGIYGNMLSAMQGRQG